MQKLRLILWCGVLLVALWVSHAHAQRAQTSHPKAYWQKRLRRVRVGMSRERVQQLLGGITFTADVDAPAELDKRQPYGAHTAFYVLDAHWCAAIIFDWHGFDPDRKRNPYTVFHFPDHRVLAPAQLLFRDKTLNARLRRFAE